MVEKHIEYGKKLCHNCIDFKNEFYRVWHNGPWNIMRHFNNDEHLISIIENLYKKASSAVVINDTNSAMLNLSTIWKSRSISLRTKIHVYKSLILSIILYGYETWTLNEILEKIINAFESKSYRRILGISYQERKTIYYVFKTIIEVIGYIEPLLSTISRSTLAHFGHTIRH